MDDVFMIYVYFNDGARTDFARCFLSDAEDYARRASTWADVIRVVVQWDGETIYEVRKGDV